MIETHESLDLARAPIGAGEPYTPPGEPTEDQVAVMRLSETCRLVSADDVDLWRFTGFVDPTGASGIESARITFTGIDDERNLHFSILAVHQGTRVEVTTHAPPEDLPLPWCLVNDASVALVQQIVDAASKAAARDAHMRATGQPVA